MNLLPDSATNHQFLRGLDLHELAEQYGTPLYLYDCDRMRERAKTLRHDLGPNLKLFYAAKANPNLHVLRSLQSHIDGLDISSGGELRQALAAGYHAGQMSFAGPGKTDSELNAAIGEGVGIISIESIHELQRADAIASYSRTKANVSVRINPAKLHKKFAIKMGGRSSQFGIDEEDCDLFFQCLAGLQNCNFVGIHVYTGTQCLDEETLIDNVANILRMAENVKKSTGFIPRVINFGGGFGIPYHEGQVAMHQQSLCGSISKLFREFQLNKGMNETTGIFELGRYLIAEAGIYIARVVDKKTSRGKTYCILDGGMNHHLPASGNFGQVVRKNYKLINLSDTRALPTKPLTFVGPICTSIDIIGDKVQMAEPAIGDCIAILNSGAYGYTVSPLFFLSHETPIELLAEGDVVTAIRPSFRADILDGNDHHSNNCQASR
jgi:diaminopimelate decarboxylase